MPIKNVLISGASVAGPAVAFWLNKAGIQTTIVELTPEFRKTGQQIDVGSEIAQTIVDRMGLSHKLLERGVDEGGFKVTDEKNRVVANYPFDGEQGVMTQKYEILRGDLAEILIDSTKETTEYIFGDKITALDETSDGVSVTFSQSSPRKFDLVIIADGMRSRTRALVFDEKDCLKRFGLYLAYFNIPSITKGSKTATWYNTTKGRNMMTRPDGGKDVRTGCILAQMNPIYQDYHGWTVQQQKELFAKQFADAQGYAPKILPAMMETDDFYMTEMSQVRLKTWSKGRVVLLGDAAYCPSPISGSGTSLAITGAYVLAGEIVKNGDDYETAFKNYDKNLRPYVENKQGFPSAILWIAYPMTQWGVWFTRVIARFVKLLMVVGVFKLAQWFGGKEKEGIVTPNYAFPGL